MSDDPARNAAPNPSFSDGQLVRRLREGRGFLVLLLVLSVAVWALFEQAPQRANGRKLSCEYTSEQLPDAKHPDRPILLCERADSNEDEYGAYTAIKRGEAWALIPALRHWLNGVVRDPLSLFTAILAFSTIFLWLSTRRLWKGAEEQGRDLKESINLARKAYVAEHRTWLEVSITALEPLTFEGDEIRVRYTISARNVGQKPATHVHLAGAAYRSVGRGINEDEVLALIAQEKALATASVGMPMALLPDQPSIELTLSQNAEKVPRLEATYAGQIAAGVPPQNLRQLVGIAYCVIYRSLVSDDWCHVGHALIVRPVNPNISIEPSPNPIAVRGTILPDNIMD